MLFIILAIITLLALLAASYSDLKTREVPDWLSYGLIFAALGMRAIFSVELGWEILLSGIFGFTVCFLLACLFYYTHQWGGGDSKLLMGMGAVIGITFPFDDSSFHLLWYFLALLFLGAIYGLFWLFFIAIKKRKIFLKEFKILFRRHKLIQIVTVIVALLFLFSSLKYPFLALIGLFLLLFLYLFLFVLSVENSCFFRKVPVDKLVPGDWLAEESKVVKKKTLTERDIIKLRQLFVKKKIKSVRIREGIPFIPSFLFAYFFLLFGSKFFTTLLQLFFS